MAGPGYRFIDHTADIEFVATGRDEGEMLSNCLLAMFATIAETAKLAKVKGGSAEISVHESAGSINDLVWYTLQDALSLSDAEGLFCYGVKRISVKARKGKYTAEAVLLGKEKEDRFARFSVKGVSQFDMKVEEKGGMLTASVVLDV